MVLKSCKFHRIKNRSSKIRYINVEKLRVFYKLLFHCLSGIGSYSTDEQFNDFSPGVLQRFQKHDAAKKGIQITNFESNSVLWITNGDHAGSWFVFSEVTQFQLLETLEFDASFNCKLYDGSRKSKTLES